MARRICALVLVAWAATGCSDTVDAKGEAGARYALLFDAAPATTSLLALADGLTGPKPEAVVVLRSMDALLGAPLVKRLKGHPLVQAAMASTKAEIGFDPLAVVATDAPVVVVASRSGLRVRLTVSGDGLMALQSAMALTEASSAPFEVLGFKGRMAKDADGELCVLSKGKEVIFGAGEGAVCTEAKAHAGVEGAWRAAVEAGRRAPAEPLLAFYHGDTRIDAGPSGIPALDALEGLGGMDHEQGLFELSAPGDELALRYRARPVNAAALAADLAAAQDLLPPVESAPAADPLLFQFLLPGSMHASFDPSMINEVLGAPLFPKQWPAGRLMPAMASFGPFGGAMAIGARDDAELAEIRARIGGTPADFDDAKAWKTDKGACGEGPRRQLICATSRVRLSAAIARARAHAVPTGQMFYMHFDLSSLQDDPARYGFPPEAVGFVKAVSRGVVQARLVDGWIDMDAQLKGSGTPIRAAALAWVRAQL